MSFLPQAAAVAQALGHQHALMVQITESGVTVTPILNGRVQQSCFDWLSEAPHMSCAPTDLLLAAFLLLYKCGLKHVPQAVIVPVILFGEGAMIPGLQPIWEVGDGSVAIISCNAFVEESFTL